MSSFAYWLPQSRTSNARTRKSRLKLPNARPFPQLQVFQRRPDQGEKMAGENIGLLGRSGPALYPKGSYLGQPLSCSSLMVKKEITRLSCHQIGNRHVSGLEGLYQWARGDRVQQLAHFFFLKRTLLGREDLAHYENGPAIGPSCPARVFFPSLRLTEGVKTAGGELT